MQVPDNWLDDYLDIDFVNWEKYDDLQKNKKNRVRKKEKRKMGKDKYGQEQKRSKVNGILSKRR
tara:strand:+ start:1352 stop:1543 length:192 start_codon:yes stop_codon:yes gene_type:complete